MVVIAEFQTRQNWRAFLPDGIEFTRIQAHKLENGRCDLHRLDPARDGPRLNTGVRYQQHHVGIVKGETAVLFLFFRAAGVNYTDVRGHDDIGRTGISTREQSATRTIHCRNAGPVKHRLERGAVENLADARRLRVVFEDRYPRHGLRGSEGRIPWRE